MSLMQMLLGAVQSGYNLLRSVRLRSSASAYLNRTFPSAGNRKTWTWSGWVKRGSIGGNQLLFTGGYSAAPWFVFGFVSDNLYLSTTAGVIGSGELITTAVYRDPSAWYHIVLSVDTTQATASNRIKYYVNGVQVTIFSTTNYPSQNADLQVNASVSHTIGGYTSLYFDGYLAEVNFIDGQALTPSSFGSTNATTGVWQPAPYTGTYGTNGFYLKFTDNSTAAALGTDFSGNSNTWTVNNISVTAGVTYDSMTDVPTLTSATAANYAVLNPLDKESVSTVSNGNLSVLTGDATGAGYGQVRSSVGMSSGKWYWEFTCESGNLQDMAGVVKQNSAITTYVGGDANGWGYYGSNGQKYNNGSGAAYGATYTAGDVIGVAFDVDGGTLTFYKNNVSQGTAFTGLTAGLYFAAHSDGSTGSRTAVSYNFGQRPFAYTPPTGFVALNTFNLPASTIVKGNTVMDATLWTGDGTSPKSQTNAAGFQPDLVWIKNRGVAYSHNLFDSVRGAGAARSLQSNNTNSESTNASDTALYGYLSAFNSNGFSTTNGTDPTFQSIWVNQSSQAFVAWQWKAGGAAVTNTAGSITSTVSVNPTAGFSVVTYTGTGANATVGHGLGVAPKMVIVKGRNTTYDWIVWQSALAGTEYIVLNKTDAKGTVAAVWNSTIPTSTVFSVGTNLATNQSSDPKVAYCWSEIDGFSKFGSYTGNGSADGPFVYTGFRPSFVLYKNTATASTNWEIVDDARNTFNPEFTRLFPNATNADDNFVNPVMDFTANGFKIRTSAFGINNSGNAFIYMAFAENPFKNALAR